LLSLLFAQLRRGGGHAGELTLLGRSVESVIFFDIFVLEFAPAPDIGVAVLEGIGGRGGYYVAVVRLAVITERDWRTIPLAESEWHAELPSAIYKVWWDRGDSEQFGPGLMY